MPAFRFVRARCRQLSVWKREEEEEEEAEGSVAYNRGSENHRILAEKPQA